MVSTREDRDALRTATAGTPIASVLVSEADLVEAHLQELLALPTFGAALDSARALRARSSRIRSWLCATSSRERSATSREVAQSSRVISAVSALLATAKRYHRPSQLRGGAPRRARLIEAATSRASSAVTASRWAASWKRRTAARASRGTL